MATIKNVTIQFSCPEKLDKKLFCKMCSHAIIDFTNRSDNELKTELKKSKGPVCGLFRKSQLSDQFLKYAAATFVATSLAIPALGQAVIKGDSLMEVCDKIENDEEVFLGMVVEIQAEPIGGYKMFFDAIKSKLKYPKGLTGTGRSFVEFTVDTGGQMKDVRLVKGFSELADKEAVRVLSTLDFPFKPGRQRGKPVKTRLVVPITFDPEDGGER